MGKVFLSISLILLAAPFALARHKHFGDRAVLARMESVSCGAKQRGLTGIGSVFAEVGVEHASTKEQLCPEYVLRTDDVVYRIRPKDEKHPTVMPVGSQAEFRIKGDRLYLKVPELDGKTREYHVVAQLPRGEEEEQGAKYSDPRTKAVTEAQRMRPQPQPQPQQ